ncbi:hypothetical protein [Paraburkholderia elongata]|uniref:Uncharacterized protein n=1 Tax=Paraburkholderia elongata TaxID=2675747 RepID=A0A972SI92_9BURK|nr:hypothetical protein [Paraburkholderia elongata]NPT55722.1 hypothetical protein [Paraburkholderia elongata]
MQLVVTRSNLSDVLAEHQPSSSSGRDALGLAAVTVVLWDLLSLSHLGRGPTGFLASGLLSWVAVSPVAAASWIAVLLDSTLLWVGMSAMRNSRWFSLYRRRLWETVTRASRLSSRPMTPASAAALGWGLVCLVYVAAMLTHGIADLTGSTPVGLLLAVLLGMGVGVLAVGVASTMRLQRFTVAGGIGLAALILTFVCLTSPPLIQTFGVGNEAAGTRFANWSMLAFLSVVCVTLFLAFEIDEESLNLLLRWDPAVDGGTGGRPFEHRPLIQTSYRRAILHVHPQGQPILLVTKTLGEPQYVVSQPLPLDESQPIDLNQTGFTIWDLHEVSKSILDAGGTAVAPTIISDSQDLVQVAVTPYAQPSTAKLPPNLRINEQTFTYLKDHVFLPGALAPQMKSAVALALRELTADILGEGGLGQGGDRLAEMSASWQADYHKLDLVHTADRLEETNVLFRTPAFINSLRQKEALAMQIIERIGKDAAQLLVLENRLRTVATDLPARVQASFIKGIDALLSTLDDEQRKAIRDVIGLFNFTAGAQTSGLDTLSALRQEARAVQAKIATDKKEAEAKVEGSQKEVDVFVQTLMASPMLSSPQRKFLEAWGNQLPKPLAPSPAPLPPPDGGSLPRPNRRRF